MFHVRIYFKSFSQSGQTLAIPVVEFDGTICHWIILKAHQVQVKNGWKASKYHSFFSFLQAMFAGIVFVVTVQCFGSNVILKKGKNLLEDWHC